MNEGKKYDQGKPRYTLLPANALAEVVQVLEHGAEKYGAENWRMVENFEERYLDAVYRHLEAFRRGHVYDTETGLTHFSHAVTSLLFLTEALHEASVRRSPEEDCGEGQQNQEGGVQSGGF